MSGCIQCGECCINYGWRLEATPLDIAKWIFDGREDILRHVLVVYDERGEVEKGVLWVDNGERVKKCPFLEFRDDGKYYCSIHNAKPEVCITHYCINYCENL